MLRPAVNVLRCVGLPVEVARATERYMALEARPANLQFTADGGQRDPGSF